MAQVAVTAADTVTAAPWLKRKCSNYQSSFDFESSFIVLLFNFKFLSMAAAEGDEEMADPSGNKRSSASIISGIEELIGASQSPSKTPRTTHDLVSDAVAIDFVPLAAATVPREGSIALPMAVPGMASSSSDIPDLAGLCRAMERNQANIMAALEIAAETARAVTNIAMAVQSNAPRAPQSVSAGLQSQLNQSVKGKIPDIIIAAIDKAAGKHDREVRKFVRARVKLDKDVKDLAVFDVEFQYPNGTKAFADPPPMPEWDEKLHEAIQDDFLVCITIPKASSRVEALRIIQWNSTKARKAIDLEAQRAHVEASRNWCHQTGSSRGNPHSHQGCK